MSGTAAKPVYRVTADSARITPVFRTEAGNTKAFVGDSFVNFQAKMGLSANNLMAESTYTLNPLSRNHVKLEYMYRGSWLPRQVVDVPANDMTRAGTIVESEMRPDDIDRLHQYWNSMQIWKRLNSTLKWSRLYGGCLAVIMTRGMRPEQPFDPREVARGDFKGLLVLDRWMVWPRLDDLVTEFGLDFGKPKYYEVVTDARAIPNMRIHHSRCIRLDGVELPYFQRIAENEWGLSVIEPFYDRMVAYDSATTGAAQLLYRAYLRVFRVDKLRDLIGQGGPMYEAFLNYMQTLKLFQSNEGISLIDSKDDFVTQQYAFSGISDMLIQFGQQLSGAANIPLTRLFGQAPAGMNATGESDMRNYYDSINAAQETDLRPGVSLLYDVTHRSLFGRGLPEGFNFSFRPLWQLDDVQKASVSTQIMSAVAQAKEQIGMPMSIVMKELRQWSRTTGLWSNITDQDIKDAEKEDNPPLPDLSDLGGGGNEDPQNAAYPSGPDLREQFGPEVASDRLTIDQYATVEVAGCEVVIETPKNTRRFGYGWSVMMPSDYGFICGTSSAEGPQEQMDAFVGPNLQSKNVWVIEQLEPTRQLFDEHKVMLGFDSRDDAVNTYVAAFNDGMGQQRIGSVTAMSVDKLHEWLQNQWRYGRTAVERRDVVNNSRVAA